MKVAGFTFISNAVCYDHPVVESVTSHLVLLIVLLIVHCNFGVNSHKDVQRFRIDSRKLYANPVKYFIYHYCCVGNPNQRIGKQKSFNKFCYVEETTENRFRMNKYDYYAVDSWALFGISKSILMENYF
jgi:hypothetical protein